MLRFVLTVAAFSLLAPAAPGQAPAPAPAPAPPAAAPTPAEIEAALAQLTGSWLVDARGTFARFDPESEMQRLAMVQAVAAQADRLPISFFPDRRYSTKRGEFLPFSVVSIEPDGLTIRVTGGKNPGLHVITFLDADTISMGMQGQPYRNVYQRFFDPGALLRGRWFAAGADSPALTVNPDGSFELSDSAAGAARGRAVMLAADFTQVRRRIANLVPDAGGAPRAANLNPDGTLTIEGLAAPLTRAALPDEIAPDWTVGQWVADLELFTGTMTPEHIRAESKKRLDADAALGSLVVTPEQWGQFKPYALEQYSPGLFALIGNGQLQAVVDVHSRDRMTLRVHHTLVIPMKRVEAP